MQKLMGSGELLDAKGHLVERGWAASEVRRYDRAAIGVAHDDPAIKEWDYYAILTPDFGLALTVADNGHMGFLGVSWMAFQARRFVNGGVGLPAPHGDMNLPSSADAGDIAHVHPKMQIAFRFAPGGRVLTVDAPDFDKGAGISGEIVLAQPPMDRMVIATPFAEQASAFYYNQKINCMPASATNSRRQAPSPCSTGAAGSGPTTTPGTGAPPRAWSTASRSASTSATGSATRRRPARTSSSTTARRTN